MELKEFVSESIKQIVAGIFEAQGACKMSRARVNPSKLNLDLDNLQGEVVDLDSGMLLSSIEFDVAVTTEEGKEAKGGIGVFVGTVGIGSQGQTDSKTSSMSRLKFNVPICFPRWD